MKLIAEESSTPGPRRQILLHRGTVYLRKSHRGDKGWWYLDANGGQWVGGQNSEDLEIIYRQDVFGGDDRLRTPQEQDSNQQ